MLNRSIFASAFFSLFCLALAAEGQVVLTFDQSGIGNGSGIDQAYGDRVVISPDTNGHEYGIGGLSTTENIEASYNASEPKLWTSGYGDLTNVYYDEVDFSTAFSLTLRADKGFDVNLIGFDVAAFGGSDITVEKIEIKDAADNLLWSQDSALISGSTHTSFDFAQGISANCVTIEIDLTGLGGASDNIGIDNVSFLQQTAGPFLLGDCNLDGGVNFQDIPSFISVLSGSCYLDEANINDDIAVNFSDIPPFIALLMNQ